MTGTKKQFLDYEGLVKVFEVIKSNFADKTAFETLLSQVGNWSDKDIATIAQAVVANQESIKALQDIVGESDINEIISQEIGKLKGEVGEDYNTLAKLQNVIKGEVTRATAAEATKADKSAAIGGATYDKTNKKIKFTSVSGSEISDAEIDVSDFIKDGMVNTVTVTDGKTDGENNGKKVLLITFNTDSGKEDIEVAIDAIFNTSNFYTKEEADGKFVTSQQVGTQITSAIENKADKTTTLGGYGITDAKIEGDVITLGDNSMEFARITEEEITEAFYDDSSL